MKSFTLQPIQEDVRRQIQATNEILEVIDRLNSIADQMTDLKDEDKKSLSNVLEKLAQISDGLLDNAGATSRFIIKAIT